MSLNKVVEIHTPRAFVTKELREISRDFTRPEEMIREAISNSLDAQTSQIYISDASKSPNSTSLYNFLHLHWKSCKSL